MYNIEGRHSEIRFSTANIINNEQVYYKDFVVDLSMVNSIENYKNILFRDGEYDGKVKLICNSHLFSNYFFRVYYENIVL